VPTWSGVAYVCFIIDAYSRMIVGWQAARSLRSDLAIDALEMATGTVNAPAPASISWSITPAA